MKWFEGSIAEAVAASKSKKGVFVVFVEGKDDASKEVARTLDSADVSSRLESEKFVVIKLQSDSENYTFFAQIYQLVPVPSVFFIGENGTPLEIIGNPLSPSEMATKIDSILLKAYPQTDSPSANLIESEQKAHSSSSNQEINKTQDSENLDQTSKDSNTNNETNDSKQELSQEEKVKRARELIELQNKKRADDEERKEREREIERRKMGKDVQKIREQQKEKEIKEAHRERMREKAAEKAARDKILKQIAEDKLERKRKYEMQVQEQNNEQQKKAQAEAQAKAQAAAAKVDMTKARIQFKLPTGNAITGTFDSATTLGTLRSYVLENAQLPFQQFAMSSFFPRRDFTTADDNKNLIELDLAPSSTILILPIKSSKPASSVVRSSDSPGIFSHFFWTLLAPVVSIYNYIMGYFTGRPRGSNATNDNNSNENNRNSEGSFGDNSPFGRFGNMAMRRLGNQGTTKIRARGNIHTLHSGDDDNDENNTWNGNSTQQM